MADCKYPKLDHYDILHLTCCRQNYVDQGDWTLNPKPHMLRMHNEAFGHFADVFVWRWPPVFLKNGLDRSDWSLYVVVLLGLAEDHVLLKIISTFTMVQCSILFPVRVTGLGSLGSLGSQGSQGGRWFSAPRQAQSIKNAPLLTLGA